MPRFSKNNQNSLLALKGHLGRETATLRGGDRVPVADVWRELITSTLMILTFTLELENEIEGDLSLWLYIRSLINIKARVHKIPRTPEWDDSIKVLNEYFFRKI